METERSTRKQRRLVIGLAAVASSAALALGFVVARDEDSDLVSVESMPTTGSTTTTGSPATTGSPTTTGSTPTSAATGWTPPSGTESTTTPIPNDTDAVGQEDQTQGGSTEDCRADPNCPSSEHRTSDPCGAAIIIDTGGYLEGRRDAEQGLAYQVDNAPAPEPADDDDDDGTVGPETRYRAGYAQGWCDGGGSATVAG
jgi:hypothetical protein